MTIDLVTLQELLLDLGDDYERLSDGGQECYNLLCRHMGVPEIVEVPPMEYRH